MRFSARFILVLAGVCVLGCASRHASPTAQLDAPPAVQQPGDSRAALPLERIVPEPFIDAPTTSPSGAAPLEALELFARARDARLLNQPYTAINLLEQALKLDDQSFEIYFALGSAYQRVGSMDKAIEAYRRASQINPNDMVLHAELGRAYMLRGDTDRGIQHLRAARLTDDYQSQPNVAAAVDYRLAVALQAGGYDRAALEVYEQLIARLENRSSPLRVNPEIAYLMSRPELLVEQVGRLYEKRSDWESALRAYRFVAERTPDDFPASARVVRALLALGRGDEAVREASELVRRLRANTESLALLQEVYERTRRPLDGTRALQALHEQRPDDRAILFALARSMSSAGRHEQAIKLLLDTAERRDGDVEIVGHLTSLLLERDQPLRAARILIESAAAAPEFASELSPLWSRLVSPARADAIRIRDLRQLPVASPAEAARLFYLSRVALAWNRPSAAEIALDQAVHARPIFPAAFRAKLDSIWLNDRFIDDQHKQRVTDELISAARAAGNAAFAAELTGLALMAQNKPHEAIRAFEEAIQLDGDSPDVQFAQALAVRTGGNHQRFEQLAWRLISDHPQFAATYPALFAHHVERSNLSGARTVLGSWLANMPDNIEARILEATVQLRFNQQRPEAERTLATLFADHPDRLDVLANLRALHSEAGEVQEFIDLLEAERTRHPLNYPAIAQLVDVYVMQQRLPEAGRVLDAARAAMAGDPDRLYFIAHLYIRVDQPQLNEQVLEQILRLDPAFAPAANDLGYTWADAGKNLDRAEALIRRAVDAEPNNPMFLDSLGWVLYKRNRFDEARRYLEEAVGDGASADPVVLDHLGDVLYRLNQPDAASQQWQRALERIADSNARDQHNELRLQLDAKLKQAQRNEPVTVAPTAGASRAPVSVKQ